MRRYTILLSALAVAVFLGWAGLQRVSSSTTEADPQIQYVTVERRPIATSINASGSVEPKAEVTLTFGTMGRLLKLLVKEGEQVTAGQVLAALDMAQFEYQVAQAEAALVAAQSQITRLESLPLPQDVEAAKAAVAIVKANLDDLEDRKNDSKVAVKPSDFQINAAKAQVDQAQANLDKVLAGASESELIGVRAQANQSYAQLEQARANMATALLKAPFDGTVSAVDAEIGAVVNQQVPVMSLADLSEFHVTVNIDQADIGRIREGQPAAVTADAFRDQPVTGRVAFIAPVAAAAQPGGVASYRIRIDIDPTAVPLRAGLTANVAITTEARNMTLVVPNRAIELDRETGKSFVAKEVDGGLARVEVETGIRNDTLSEVIAGLAEGDRVVVRTGMTTGSIADLFYMPGQNMAK